MATTDKVNQKIQTSWLIYMWGNKKYSYDDMAACLGVKKRTVYMRVDRYKKKGILPYHRGYINKAKPNVK